MADEFQKRRWCLWAITMAAQSREEAQKVMSPAYEKKEGRKSVLDDHMCTATSGCQQHAAASSPPPEKWCWQGGEGLYLELSNADLGLARCNLVKQVLEGRRALLHICLCNYQTPHVSVPLHLHHHPPLTCQPHATSSSQPQAATCCIDLSATCYNSVIKTLWKKTKNN